VPGGWRGFGINLVRSVRMWGELVSGFWSLRRLGPSVTVFGSSRIDENHPDYAVAYEVGRLLGAAGYDVVTGGGPGVMEAASRGARDAGARSVGCAIKVAHDQPRNNHLDQRMDFEYFFVRKLMMVEYSRAFIFLPGGFGTVDEVFEVATLIQTGKLSSRPVVGVGEEYWSAIRHTVDEVMVASGAIRPGDASIIHIAADAPSAVAYLLERLGRP
jgi:uncharacterized protein (TIGR00730 family)